MSLNNTFQNAVQIMFGELADEWAVSMNPLKKIFNFMPNDKYKQTIDFVTSVDDSLDGFSGTAAQKQAKKDALKIRGTQRYARNQDTPERLQLKWKRRSSKGIGAQLPLAIPRADIQTIGRGKSVVMAKYKKRLNEWFERTTLENMLELMTESYFENPSIAEYGDTSNSGAGEEIHFNNKYSHIFKGIANANKFSAPLDVRNFFFLTADLQNSTFGSETEESINRNTGKEGALKSKCTIIISNTGYANWKYLNWMRVGNRDYMGKSITIGGAEIHEFQDYRFLTLPDNFMSRQKALSGSSLKNNQTASLSSGQAYLNTELLFPNPAKWSEIGTQLLTGEQHASSADTRAGNYISESGYASSADLERAIVFDPKAFMFYNPTALNVDFKLTEDYTKSYEYFIYKQNHVECIRVWDPLVRQLLYTPGEAMTGVYV